jgi:spermidine/putrescine transport system permease protein
MLWMIVFFLIPSFVVYTYAFKPSDLYGGVGEGWTLQTFLGLGNLMYLKLLLRTLWLSAITTLVTLLLAVPVGYHLITISKKKRNLLLLMLIVPFWSSLLIRIFAWKTLLHPEGIFHRVLEAFSLISPNTTLLYNSVAVTFVMIYTFLPFAVLPVYASATKFNLELIEAAMDLGATRMQAILKVFLPAIETGIATAAMMVFIPAVGTYVIPDLVGGVNSEMLGNKIAQKTFVERDLPHACALSVILALVVFIILLIVRQYTGPQRKIRIYDEVRNRE